MERDVARVRFTPWGEAHAAGEDEPVLLPFVDRVPDGAVYVLDIDGQVTGWNGGAESLHHYAAHEVLGRHYRIFATRDDQRLGDPDRALWLARRDGAYIGSAWRVRKDGSRFLASIAIHPIHNESAALVGFAVLTRDVSGRRPTEQALREAAMLRTLIDTAADAVIVAKTDGSIQMANLAASRLFGHTAEALSALNLRDLLAAPELDVPAKPIECFLRDVHDAGGSREVQGRRGDALVPLSISVGEAGSGDDGMFVAIMRDLTEHNRKEAEVRAAQKMQAIGRLAAGVAHDFNNILQTILGNLELLLSDTVVTKDQEELAAAAREAAQRGASLTNQLLAYTRQQMLLPAPVRVGSLIENIQLLLGRTLGPQITVETAIEPGIPAVRADRAQLQTALINLGINAADAMPGGGRVVIDAYEALDDGFGEAQPGHYVVLAVTDSGSGMTVDVLDRAFDPFFTTKGVNGTGLGLPMVLGFSRQSGGDARIFSVPERGTRVEMWLPVAEAETEGGQAAPAPRPQGSGRVLLVEDLPDVLDTTGMFLRRGGFTVVPSASGEQALALFEAALASETPFDAVVTDYAMPGMSGLDLIEALARLRPDLPTVMITGFVEIDERRLPHPARLLRKPFRRDDLVSEVIKAIGDARRA